MKQTHLAEQVYYPANEEFLNVITERIICLIYSGQENVWDFTIWKEDEQIKMSVPCLEEARFRFSVSKSVEPHKVLAKSATTIWVS